MCILLRVNGTRTELERFVLHLATYNPTLFLFAGLQLDADTIAAKLLNEIVDLKDNSGTIPPQLKAESLLASPARWEVCFAAASNLGDDMNQLF